MLPKLMWWTTATIAPRVRLIRANRPPWTAPSPNTQGKGSSHQGVVMQAPSDIVAAMFAWTSGPAISPYRSIPGRCHEPLA
jgi:hypothetical protein